MSRYLSKSMQFRVFVRDGWHCRYCGSAVFFSPSLKLLDQMSPGRGYYDRNGRRGVMLTLLEKSCACCVRVVAYSKGGEANEENLRTSCFACIGKKSDDELPPGTEPGARHRPAGWDGFASLYPLLDGANPEWCRVIERELPK